MHSIGVHDLACWGVGDERMKLGLKGLGYKQTRADMSLIIVERNIKYLDRISPVATVGCPMGS